MILDALVLHLIQKSSAQRCDGAPQAFYFTEKDYGISAEPFSFYSGKNLLRGKKYFDGDASKQDIIVFFHGHGAGHSAYMQEIAYLVKAGFIVFSYDSTGCMMSEGKDADFLPRGLYDQKAFFEYLDQREDAKGKRRYAVGHSRGGFMALGALQEGYRVEKVVSISGFMDLQRLVCSREPFFSKAPRLLYKALKRGYGDYGVINMLDVIEKAKKPVYCIFGENDPIVSPKDSYELLKERFGSCDYVKMTLKKNAMHNPYWTLRAEEFFYRLNVKEKYFSKEFDNSYVVDYRKLDDDLEIMKSIVDFINC